VAQVSSIHLAPTTAAAVNLLNESVPASRVLITGNTVVDALRHMVDRAGTRTVGDPRLDRDRDAGRLVVVTAHRRESWGEPIRRIGGAVATLARHHPETTFAVAAHMNRVVRAALETETTGLPNVVRCGPIPYAAFVGLLARADLVLTDSGGIQEEAASLGVRTLVTRDTTERLEAVEAGIAVLVGTDGERIVAEAEAVLAAPRRGPDEQAVSPYGDGRAAERVVNACGWLLGLEERPADYVARLPAAQRH
jgi:UDP-N-acetylglucosamine 2-epimerase (non-hydrolysing)